MQLIEDNNDSAFQIRAFKPGNIQVNDRVLTRSAILSATQLIEDWPPQSLQELTREHMAQVLTLKPTIVLIGTGAKLIFPSMDLYGELLNQGIGVEIMDTHAACRTFAVLAAEGRDVVAALLIR